MEFYTHTIHRVVLVLMITFMFSFTTGAVIKTINRRADEIVKNQTQCMYNNNKE